MKRLVSLFMAFVVWGAISLVPAHAIGNGTRTGDGRSAVMQQYTNTN